MRRYRSKLGVVGDDAEISSVIELLRTPPQRHPMKLRITMLHRRVYIEAKLPKSHLSSDKIVFSPKIVTFFNMVWSNFRIRPSRHKAMYGNFRTLHDTTRHYRTVSSNDVAIRDAPIDAYIGFANFTSRSVRAF